MHNIFSMYTKGRKWVSFLIFIVIRAFTPQKNTHFKLYGFSKSEAGSFLNENFGFKMSLKSFVGNGHKVREGAEYTGGHFFFEKMEQEEA